VENSKAVFIYTELCKIIDEKGWKSLKNAEKLLVNFKAEGKDKPMNFSVFVDEENFLIKLLSYIDVNIQTEKRKEIAFAVCAVNNRIIDGNFDYNHKNGNMLFRMTNSYSGVDFNASVLEYMLEYSTYIVDKYDTLLKGMADGIMSMDEFFQIAFCSNSNDVNETFEKKSKAAQIYETVRNYVLGNGIEVLDSGNMTLKFAVIGEDIKIPLIVSIDSHRELIKLHSPMPFGISKEKSLECALAVCDANFGMADGCFEYDANAGFLEYRTEVSYSHGDVGEELLGYLFGTACETIDKYNHKFLIFGK
jgi:hypothetical protein